MGEENTRNIERIMERMKGDTRMRAHLSRADNPNTEHYSYRYLSPYWSREISEVERRVKESYQTVCASIARKRVEKNGSRSLIRELRRIYAGGGRLDEKSPAHAKVQRVFACRTSIEANACIRSILRLVESKDALSLDYARLLGDLIYFGERVRERWAKEFYVYVDKEDGNVPEQT